MFDFVTAAELSALGQVIMIDLVLAGDNAVVVGMAAAGLPREQRTRVILFGTLAATVLRILFAGITVQLLQIVGLVLAGGVLLAWVAWKMWRELEIDRRGGHDDGAGGAAKPPPKTMRAAIAQIVVADVSMSLDNVLAVAGAAREHFWVLVVGLVFSVGFMGLAASAIARLLQNNRWIAYVGLALIVYVAGKMIWDGAHQVAYHL